MDLSIHLSALRVVHIQGVSWQTFVIQFALASRNIQVRSGGGLGIRSTLVETLRFG